MGLRLSSDRTDCLRAENYGYAGSSVSRVFWGHHNRVDASTDELSQHRKPDTEYAASCIPISVT